eukprot:380431-Lingulodinium_polyedra.AAC.1
MSRACFGGIARSVVIDKQVAAWVVGGVRELDRHGHFGSRRRASPCIFPPAPAVGSVCVCARGR